jgi:hypothetical protein
MRYDHPPHAKRSRKLGRIAIWSREKFIFAIVIGIWVAEVSFQINGKCHLPITGKSLVYLVTSQV